MVRHADSPVQVEMDLSGTTQKGPSIALEDIQALERVLKTQDWVTAEHLAEMLGGKWTDRKVRAAARAAAPGIVSYPGSPGYKLIENCSLEEIRHCINAFESQARDMTQRAFLYNKAYHSGGRV